MDRTTRQKLAIKRWSQNNGCATLILPTGFGVVLTRLLYN